MKIKSNIFFTALVLMVSIGFSSQTFAAGPSFDCAKANTSIEKALCRFSWLGDKDAQMAKAYKKQRNNVSSDYKKIIKQEQRAWIKSRNKSCGKLTVLDEDERWEKGGDITTCLSKFYDKRLRHLNAQSTRHGEWNIFSIEGLVYARHVDSNKKVIIFEAINDAWVAGTGASSEHATNATVLDIKIPFVTTVVEDMSRFGAYYKYAYKVNVINLETGKIVSLEEVFPEEVIIKQANNSCSKFGCMKQHSSLTSLVDELKYECASSSHIALNKSIFSGFTLNNLNNNEIEVSVLFHNPCLSEDAQGFDPINWMLKLDVSEAQAQSFKRMFSKK